jgi:[acyl-carrier-protein] S-malonyltransferase
MQPAQHQLTSVLEAIPLSDPAFPVACNVDARLLTRHTDVLDALIRQVTGPVRWVECLELLVTQGATHLIEVGPGRVLTGLSRQILKKHPAEQQIMCLSVHDKATLDKTLAAFTFNPSPVE